MEHDYHRLLEFDSGVRSFWEQPFRIEYVLDGETHPYTPDVLVERTDGRRQVFEVKEEKEARLPENNCSTAWCVLSATLDDSFQIMK